jgi:hypothetical protein
MGIEGNNDIFIMEVLIPKRRFGTIKTPKLLDFPLHY